MTLAFVVGIIVSLLTPEPEAQRKFEDEKVRTYLGVGRRVGGAADRLRPAWRLPPAGGSRRTEQQVLP